MSSRPFLHDVAHLSLNIDFSLIINIFVIFKQSKYINQLLYHCSTQLD